MNTNLFPLIAFTAFILLFAGCLPEEKEEAATPQARPVSYITLQSTNPSLRSLVAGSVESWKKELVGFQVGGRVSFMREPGTNIDGRLFDEAGALIEPGTIMGSIESERYDVSVKEAEARVASALAEVEVVRADIEQVIPNQIREVQADHTRAQEEYDRQNTLLARGSGTRKRVEDALAELDTAKARLAQLEARKEEKEAELTVVKAKVSETKESLRAAELDLADTKLYSPFNGQISRVHVIPGGYVERGQPVATVQMMDPMKIQVAVSPEVDQQVNFNDLVDIYVDSADAPLQGWVWNKDTVADASTRTFMVTLLVRNRQTETHAGVNEMTKGLARTKGLWNLEAENADGQPPYFINEAVLHHDESGPFVWMADGLSIGDLDRAYDPVFPVRKTRIALGDRRKRFLQVFTYREVTNLGDLDPLNDLLTDKLPDDVSDGDSVLLSRKRWQLRPGQLVRVDLQQGRMPVGFYVPASAITKTGDAHHVFVVEQKPNGEELAKRISVTAGPTFGALQAISTEKPGHLRNGQKLISEGAHFLSDGDLINAAFEQEISQ